MALGEETDFGSKISPICKQHGYQCHGGEKQKGGLRLDHKAGAFAKADSGELAIRAGEPNESELVKRIRSDDDDLRMPPDGPRLSQQQIDTISRWIERGSEWPDDSKPVARSEMIVTQLDRQHWAFQPLHSPALPRLKSLYGSTSPVSIEPIDTFILAALEQNGLNLAKQESGVKLARRIYSRRRPQRLEAEVLRDSMLAIANTVHDQRFGPGFKPPIAAEAMTARKLKSPYNRLTYFHNGRNYRLTDVAGNVLKKILA